MTLLAWESRAVLVQGLKGRVWIYRASGSEAESSLGEELAEQGGPVLDAFEPVLHGRGEPVPCTAGSRLRRLFTM